MPPRPIKRKPLDADQFNPIAQKPAPDFAELREPNVELTNQQVRGTQLSEADSAKMDQIVQESKSVDPVKVSVEVLDWLIANVEEYVDNAETIYRVYFTPEAISACAEAGKLQKLFLDIPETGHVKEVECIDAIQEVTTLVKEAMENDAERMQKLFDRLVFFYDTKFGMVGGKKVPITVAMDGKVTLHEFLFDTVGQKVRVVRKNVEMTKEDMQAPDAMKRVKDAVAAGNYKEVVTEIDQPAGFALEMEISYWPKV